MDQCRPERHAVFVDQIYNAVFNSITQSEIVFSRDTSSGGGLLQFHTILSACAPVSLVTGSVSLRLLSLFKP